MTKVDIRQLTKTEGGEKFYPQTHIDGVVGNDTIAYLGDVEGQSGGGGSVGGKLSVSPRQSIVVGRAIPKNPRKGKKYYFPDGVIKVKKDNPGQSRASQVDLYTALWQQLSHSGNWAGQNGHAYHACIVTILDEGPFSTSKCLVTSPVENFCSITESPFLDIVNRHIVNNEIPYVPPAFINEYGWGEYFAAFNTTLTLAQRNKINLSKHSGKKIHLLYLRNWRGDGVRVEDGNGRARNPGYSTRKYNLSLSRIDRKHNQLRIYTYRRNHKSRHYQALKIRWRKAFDWI